MLELLEHFTIPQILLFIVLLCVAYKKISDFLDWLKDKIHKRDKKKLEDHDKEQKNEERAELFEAQMLELKQEVANMSSAMEKVVRKVDILMESDKDAIKAWITKEHHYYCYQKGWIDDYSMDCLERRYSHYVEEHGNSFISDLMDEIRSLPKQEVDVEGEHKT